MLEPRCYLHHAPYVIPVDDDPRVPDVIFDGAVLTRDGVIEAVGSLADLQNDEAVPVNHHRRILFPALSNCHCHLELSAFADLAGRPPAAGDITGWIRLLLAERERDRDPEEVRYAAALALARLYGSGCRGVADIGNDPDSREIGRDFKVTVNFFQEFIGLGQEACERARLLVDGLDEQLEVTGHAPYSTDPAILIYLKERARRLGHLFPIHLAESLDEVAFLAAGDGRLRDFLEERQVWDGDFVVPGKSPVAYLNELGILDRGTLCVHAVHCSEEDIAILAEAEAPVCLCPGSNRFLGVGAAPLAKMLDYGLKISLGTDSMASNPDFSLWQEMKILAGEHPEVDPLEIIRIATVNGSEILGQGQRFGCLKPGLSANFLAVGREVPAGMAAGKLFSWLIEHGGDSEKEWVEMGN